MPLNAKLRTAAALLGLLALTACAQPSAPPRGEGPRVIVLVTVDGLVPSDLALFGGPTAMPALERLAGGGRAWSDGWSAAPMTRPGVATYLTGLAPDRHGVRDDLFTPLGEDVPTLAGRLAEAGYTTAAFPDSAFLNMGSGLLRGFALVSDPPALPMSPARFQPAIRDPAHLADDFDAWAAGLPAGARYFAWFHFSGALNGQLREVTVRVTADEESVERRLERRERAQGGAVEEKLDAALGRVLDAIEKRGELAGALVVVAGTLGDARGGESGAAGAGSSLEAEAVRVPVVVGWGEAPDLRPADETVWAPDVSATILDAAGLAPDEGSEGVSLLRAAPDARTLFAWSWATLDQMGWPALRSARSGNDYLIEGVEPGGRRLDDPAAEVSEESRARLALALEGRAEPRAAAVPIDQVRPLLEARGLRPRPAPVAVEPADPAKREEVAALVSAARHLMGGRRGQKGKRLYARVLEIDPDNRAARLDLGQMASMTEPAEGARLLGGALERFPTDPELLHWYAHAIWDESWQASETILDLILPHKPQEWDVLYDLACTRSLAGDLDGSESFLRRAIGAGFRDFRHMETDRDLRALRESGRLSTVLRELE